MGATKESVAEYALKHGVSEDVVRDIAGIDDDEPIEVTAEAKGHTASFAITGHDGDVVVDFGDGAFQIVSPSKGKFTHDYPLAGSHRVRVDAAGQVRWLDVVTETDAPDEEGEPAPAPRRGRSKR